MHRRLFRLPLVSLVPRPRLLSLDLPTLPRFHSTEDARFSRCRSCLRCPRSSHSIRFVFNRTHGVYLQAASAAVPAYADAPYSVSQATVRKAITCPFRSLDSQTPRAGGEPFPPAMDRTALTDGVA